MRGRVREEERKGRGGMEKEGGKGGRREGEGEREKMGDGKRCANNG